MTLQLDGAEKIGIISLGRYNSGELGDLCSRSKDDAR